MCRVHTGKARRIDWTVLFRVQMSGGGGVANRSRVLHCRSKRGREEKRGTKQFQTGSSDVVNGLQ